MWLQLIVVLTAIIIGARLGGIGLGVIGVLVGAFCSMKVGKELEDDPEYQRHLKEA